MKFWYAITQKPYLIWGFFVGLSVIIVLQLLNIGTKTYNGSDHVYLFYNNYVIFQKAHFHLLDYKDLYVLYLDEQWDLYKYSPTFALFFGLFAYFPDGLGLTLWTLVNVLVLVGAIYYLPKLNVQQKALMCIIVMVDLVTSIQNTQSNALMAGLIIFSVGLLERRYYALAALCLVSSVYIKIFGVVGFALFLLYPQKWKAALWTSIWTLVLFVLPLCVVSVSQLQFLYQSWGNLLSNDHSSSYGYSLMGWLNSWFGLEKGKNILVALGVLLFLLPLGIQFKRYKEVFFRYTVLASVLLWIVVFNHKAESPTFVIAMSGVALWFVGSKPKPLTIALLLITILCTSLSTTDIFPRDLREGVFRTYAIKGIACVFVWLKLLYDMILYPKHSHE